MMRANPVADAPRGTLTMLPFFASPVSFQQPVPGSGGTGVEMYSVAGSVELGSVRAVVHVKVKDEHAIQAALRQGMRGRPRC